MADLRDKFRFMSEPKLTPKEKRFITEYLKDLNGTKAAIRAGYSTDQNTASTQAHRLLTKANIRILVDEAMRKRAADAGLSAQYVINRMLEIDQLDVMDIITEDFRLRPLVDWPVGWRRYLNGFEVVEMFEADKNDPSGQKLAGSLKKIKWPDKTKNLELLGRHFGIFNDKLQVTGPGGQPLVIPTVIRIVAGPINVPSTPNEPDTGNGSPGPNTA